MIAIRHPDRKSNFLKILRQIILEKPAEEMGESLDKTSMELHERNLDNVYEKFEGVLFLLEFL